MTENNRMGNAFIVSFVAMLSPMIIAARLFGNTSMLVPLYAIGYIISVIAILRAAMVDEYIVLPEHYLVLLITYVLILSIPIIHDFIYGVKFNYFDFINVFIKVLNLFLFFIIMLNIRIEEKSLLKFFKFIVGLSVFACLYSFIFEFKDILSIRYISNTNVLAIRSFFSNRNQYSAFLVIAFIANTYLMYIEKKKYSLLIYIIQIIGVLTTFSRAAFFSIAIIIFLMLWQSSKPAAKVFLIICFGILLISIIGNSSIIQYISSRYLRLDSSGDSGRFRIWKYAWDIAKESAFLGVGFYTGADIAMDRGMGLTQFHNMFFDLLVDGGFLEILFVISIFAYSYYRCSKCAKNAYFKIYRAALASFCFHALVESLSVFALSYSDIMYTIFYISLPLLLSNMNYMDSGDSKDLLSD